MPIGRAKLHFDNLFEDNELSIGAYLLYQAGDLACEGGYTVEEHDQVVDEISYIVSGEGTFIANGKEFPVKKGDVIVSAQGERHNIFSSQINPIRFFYIGFTFKHPNQLPYSQLISILRTPGIKRVNGTPLFDCFVSFMEELAKPDDFSSLMLESLLSQLICATTRLLLENKKQRYFSADNSAADHKLIRDIAAYLDTHACETPKLRELSSRFGYSYTHISQLFSSVMGESLKAYHTRRRFEKACDELDKGLTVTHVAEFTGFQSVHAFSRAFTKQIGITPKEYKEKNKGEFFE
ncbi:MAG: helix-turn-helix transcriptional regulator [Ruminococcaceae bacterium]|nr:helix-turn-helix transcriptional regulator [Oscillospiraceae bacterium]